MHPLAGKPAPKSILADIPALVSAYYTVRPDPADPRCLVSFGTSGHRGSSSDGTFNEDHILAMVQAICAYRQQARSHRAALPRQGHPRPVRTGPEHRAGGARGQRRGNHGRAGRRLHPHPVDLPRHPGLQPRPELGPGRRHRHHPLPQSARKTAASSTTRPTAVRPTPISPDWMRGPGQRAAARGQPRGAAHALRAGPQGRTTSACTISSPPMWRTWAASWTWTPSAPPGLRMGVDALGGAGAGLLGAHRRALRPEHRSAQRPTVDPTFGFMPWTRTARSAWTAPRPRPWPA